MTLKDLDKSKKINNFCATVTLFWGLVVTL